MDNSTERNKVSRCYSKRKRPELYGLLAVVFILCSYGIVYGFSTEVGDTCAGVTAGGYHTCILNSEGDVYCYGNNFFGQAVYYTDGDAIGVSTGPYNTCVLLGNGNVDCYGYNNDGQAEDYTGEDAVGVSIGLFHSCILKSNGNVACRGQNGSGQAEGYAGGDAVGISVGYYHTCVLKSNGNVACNGYNRYGQSIEYDTGDAVGVSAGGDHTCVLKSNGNVVCNGYNGYGQAVEYDSGDAVGVSAGGNHTCIFNSEGNVYCYGNNSYGQAVEYDTGDAVGVSAGGNHTCVLVSDGYLNCFGLNNYGQAENYSVGDAVCMPESTNQPPVFDPIESIYVLEYDLVDFVLTAIDPDGDDFVYSCEGLPAGSVFDANNGIFSWIPSYDQAGTHIISFLATDDGTPNETGQLDVIITVNDISPSALVDRIIDIIKNDMNLPHNVVKSYLANLKKVNEFIRRGKVTPAINQLDAFIKKVKADVRKGLLSDDEDQMFRDMVNDIKFKLKGNYKVRSKGKPTMGKQKGNHKNKS